jgi:hypothetical protein
MGSAEFWFSYLGDMTPDVITAVKAVEQLATPAGYFVE